MTEPVTQLGATTTDAQAVINAAYAAAAPSKLDPSKPQALVVPEGAHVEYPDLSAWQDAPQRATGIYRPATVESFAAYVNEHYAPSRTTLWVHPTSGVIVAVLDDHRRDGPDWREHRVELRLTVTPEWRYWSERNDQMLSQEAFAEHIEGGLEEIVEPEAAAMLEIAQSFHAASSATFRQSIRLASGEQRLQYDEELQASAGTTGEMTVPTGLLLAISPFIGEDLYRLAARLRFRVRSGSLTLGYKLDRPEAVVRDALEKIAEKLAGQFARTYIGDPPL